jgi:hypothetical protein
MKAIGGVLIGVGLAWLGWAAMLDTTVVVMSQTYSMPTGRVHNLGLVERRRTHLMLAGGTILVGTILMGFGSMRRDVIDDADEDLLACPHCAELVQSEAIYCRHCKRDIPALATEPTDVGRAEGDAGGVHADPEHDADAGIHHSYRDLRTAAEAAEAAERRADTGSASS